MREAGYYFVKHHKKDDWEPALWTGGSWYQAGSIKPYSDSDLYEIDEEMIVRKKIHY